MLAMLFAAYMLMRQDAEMLMRVYRNMPRRRCHAMLLLLLPISCY